MNEACPLPSPKSNDEMAVISRLVKAHRIAVVGLSNDPTRVSYAIAAYLQSVGKQIIPVNPNVREVLGVKAAASLAEIEGAVELVDVFRRSEACEAIAREAVAIGAKGLWLQSGIVSLAAREIARAAGVGYVENRCLMIEHRTHGS